MEGAEATWDKLNTEPPGHGHNSVVKDVQECDLIVFLAQYEEQRVSHLNKFRHVKNPTNARHLRQLNYNVKHQNH